MRTFLPAAAAPRAARRVDLPPVTECRRPSGAADGPRPHLSVDAASGLPETRHARPSALHCAEGHGFFDALTTLCGIALVLAIALFPQILAHVVLAIVEVLR